MAYLQSASYIDRLRDSRPFVSSPYLSQSAPVWFCNGLQWALKTCELFNYGSPWFYQPSHGQIGFNASVCLADNRREKIRFGKVGRKLPKLPLYKTHDCDGCTIFVIGCVKPKRSNEAFGSYKMMNETCQRIFSLIFKTKEGIGCNCVKGRGTDRN